MNFNDLVKKLNTLDYKDYFYKNGLDALFKKKILFSKKKIINLTIFLKITIKRLTHRNYLI